jgi:hypothetical protein
LLGVAVSLTLAQLASAAETCAFPQAPRVLESSGDPHARGSRLLQLWEMDDAPIWWSNQEPSGYEAFRAQAAAKAGDTDPIALLRQAPSRNNALVEQNAADWIGPATCLEMLLQQTQHQRLDTFVQPTEFGAAVLRSPDARRLRVYFYTINEDGIGNATPFSGPAARDAAAGWKVLALLHNHNFHPGQPELNGALAPSKPDARFNMNFAMRSGMAQAWITNGLHTARIPARAFPLFDRD